MAYPHTVLSMWRGEIPRPKLANTARDIIAEVAKRRDVTPDEICGPSRLRPIAHARQEAMYLIYATGQFSLPWIGKRMGRDHSTVLHGIRRHAERMAAQ